MFKNKAKYQNNEGFVMRYFVYLGLLGLVACTKEPNVAVRIDCGDYNDKGLQATLNGQPVGDCPVDIMMHAGEVNVSVRKDNEDASYLFAEAKMTLAENAMKRIKLDVKPVFTEEYYYERAQTEQGMIEYLEYSQNVKRKKDIEKKLENIRFDSVKDSQTAKLYLGYYPDSFRHAEVKKIIDDQVAEKIKAEQASEMKKFEPYIDNKDGTVTDKLTGLIWARCSYGQKWTASTCTGKPKEVSWHEAINLRFNLAGKNDWRLPSIQELLTLTKCKNGREPLEIPINGRWVEGKMGTCLNLPNKEDHTESDLSVNTHALKGFILGDSYTWIFFSSSEPDKYNSLGQRDVFIYYPLRGGWGTTSRDERNLVRFVRGQMK